MKRLLCLLLLVLVPLLSYAEDSKGGFASTQFPDCQTQQKVDKQNLLTPPPCDVSKRYLGYVFGNVGTVLAGSGSQVLAAMFQVFNSAVLALGAFVMLYVLVVSTLNTAQEGEVLGRKWSSIWIPLRSAIGVALLIPQTGGYSVLQAIIMWLVIQGVGAADSVWTAMIDYIKTGGTTVNPGQKAQSNAIKAIGSMLRQEVCMYALQDVINNTVAPDEPPLSFGASVTEPVAVTRSSKPQSPQNQLKYPGQIDFPGVVYDGKNPIKDYVGACGSITWTLSKGDDEEDEAANTAKNNAVQRIFGYIDPIARDIVCTAEAQDLLFGNDHHCSGSDSINEVLKQNADRLIQAANAYQGDMGIVLNEYEKKKGDRDIKFAEQAIGEGWIMAGKYYLDLTRINTEIIVSSNNQAPNAVPVNKGKLVAAVCPNSENCDDANSILELMSDSTLKESIKDQEKAGSDDVEQIEIGDPVAANTSAGSQAGAILSFGLSEVVGAFQDLLSARSSGVNPVFAVSALGSGMINFATMVWLSGAVIALLMGIASICSCILPVFNMLNNFFSILSGFLIPILMAIFTAGATLAYYVPMIPYILLTFSGIGWLVAILEAMIAAPLVALGVIHPEGHEHFGKAEPAIMLLVSIFMRPTLIIFGFIGGIMISYISVWLINEGFSTAIDVWKASLAGIGALLSFLAFLFIYTGLVTAVIHKAFSLIHVIPDEVLRWIGGQGKSIYGEAEGAKEVQGSFEKGMSSAGEVVKGVAQYASKQAQQMSKSGSVSGGGDDDDGGGGGGGGGPEGMLQIGGASKPGGAPIPQPGGLSGGGSSSGDSGGGSGMPGIDTVTKAVPGVGGNPLTGGGSGSSGGMPGIGNVTKAVPGGSGNPLGGGGN